MGTPDFAVPSLETLLAHGYDVCAVVTGPDKPRGRGQALVPSPVKQAASRHQLVLLEPVSVRESAFAENLRQLRPDLAVVVAFRILPPEVFSLPPLGCFNLHASLLPRYRGAAPIQRALMAGETETGVTTFFLDEKVDTGAMILQRRVEILPEEDFGSLHDRLAVIGAEAVLDTVRLIESGAPPRVVQDSALASAAPKITKDDLTIRWDRPSVQVVNHVRALAPHPGAATEHHGTVLKVYRARVATGAQRLPAGVLHAEPARLLVGTADEPVDLLDIQQAGRKRMTAGEFLRGYRVRSGDRLGG